MVMLQPITVMLMPSFQLLALPTISAKELLRSRPR
jgi:hypothetical protein